MLCFVMAVAASEKRWSVRTAQRTRLLKPPAETVNGGNAKGAAGKPTHAACFAASPLPLPAPGAHDPGLPGAAQACRPRAAAGGDDAGWVEGVGGGWVCSGWAVQGCCRAGLLQGRMLLCRRRQCCCQLGCCRSQGCERVTAAAFLAARLPAGSGCPCFKSRVAAVQGLKKRFHLALPEPQVFFCPPVLLLRLLVCWAGPGGLAACSRPWAVRFVHVCDAGLCWVAARCPCMQSPGVACRAAVQGRRCGPIGAAGCLLRPAHPLFPCTLPASGC